MHDKAIAIQSAPFLARIASMIYESLLVAAVIFVASLVSVLDGIDLQVPWQMYLFRVYLMLVLFAYFGTFWLRSGQTLAMKTWRIRLVNQKGELLTLKQAALRYVLAWLGLLLAGAGFWWALFDRDGQFFHDHIVGTRLIRVPRKA